MTMHDNEGHSPAKTWAELSLMTAVIVIANRSRQTAPSGKNAERGRTDQVPPS